MSQEKTTKIYLPPEGSPQPLVVMALMKEGVSLSGQKDDELMFHVQKGSLPVLSLPEFRISEKGTHVFLGGKSRYEVDVASLTMAFAKKLKVQDPDLVKIMRHDMSGVFSPPSERRETLFVLAQAKRSKFVRVPKPNGFSFVSLKDLADGIKQNGDLSQDYVDPQASPFSITLPFWTSLGTLKISQLHVLAIQDVCQRRDVKFNPIKQAVPRNNVKVPSSPKRVVVYINKDFGIQKKKPRPFGL